MNKSLLKIIIIILSISVFSCNKKDIPKKDIPKKSTLFLTTNNGNLYSIDLLTGKCNWQNIKNIEDTRSDSYFKINNNTIIKSYENGQIIIFNKQTGDIIKQYQENEPMNENSSLFMFAQYPLVYENAFIFCNLNGKVKSVNLNTMQPNWVYDGIKTNVFVSPAIIKDRIIVNAGYNLCAINAKNGEWITRLEFVQPLPQEPVVSDGEIFVVDEKGNAFCFDEELNIKWQFEVNKYISDTEYDEYAKVNKTIDANIQILANLTAGKKLIVSGDAKHIIGIDKKNGEMKWLTTIPTLDLNSPDDVAEVKKNIKNIEDFDSIMNENVHVLKSLQILDEEVVANSSSCIVVYNSNDGTIKRKKFFFTNEIIGGIKVTNDFYYYLRKDGVLYKLDKTLKNETVVYKGINYKPEDEYTNPYMQIE
ncbi:PQQ-like beta-propeller repeat protein [Flavobacterium sp. ZT3R18]|uniref:outer membrane protein assembly factor BamB family protein n=1 Tax=Flavobacterium sp. ZT3R18 TaxID=2594429 RepID=UPI00117B5F4B|nr:PQQ-binding-like beta-propeller repeat protein [Flavobacterium sp. ZT3R18]TRX38025.1 PQQ-like beta-propeller repeat protein [Flavobacterium sp. ZT3R18]